ncbi:MAG TPA: DUF429 domain-containing protein [Mycobacteriales bacterium]|nr:DUF429 domain-containing protein [Mycobacteriales bacterium]
MPLVAGVDGCPGGWVAALVDEDAGTCHWRLLRDAVGVIGLLHEPGVHVVGIDIPIGLPEPGRTRAADTEARAELRERRSCVFPAPPREVLAENDYRLANAAHRRLMGKGLSKQAFFIGARIVDVDRAMTPALADRVVEVHPELVFARLAGRPVGTKKTPAGLDTRAALLAPWLPAVAEAVAGRPRGARADDALDALACAQAASRWRHGTAVCWPTSPAYDARGLPMRMVC